MGEEDFFINNITKLLIDNVLTNDEKQFNLNILYAKDTSVNEIVYLCRKYPIMSNYQVVLIKEAQNNCFYCVLPTAHTSAQISFAQKT